MSTEAEATRPKKRKPKSPELLDLEDLADRWGKDEESLKRLVRSEGVPFIGFTKLNGDRIKWDKVLFRLEAVRRWEAEHQDVYSARKERKEEQDPELSAKSKMPRKWRR